MNLSYFFLGMSIAMGLVAIAVSLLGISFKLGDIRDELRRQK